MIKAPWTLYDELIPYLISQKRSCQSQMVMTMIILIQQMMMGLGKTAE